MAEPLRVLVAEARFYEDLADEMLAGAAAELAAAGAAWERISVPGAFELPGVVRMAVAAGGRGETTPYDAFVALGCVIRGETSHYDHVCQETSRGLMELVLRHGIALGFGVLTCDTGDQAWARARRGEGDKGAAAARAALAMAGVRRRFGLLRR